MTCFTQKFHHQRTNNTFLIEKCLAFLAEDDHKRLYKSDLCLFACHTWSEWVDDGKVAIAANGHHCVSWDENGNGLRETDNSAHDRTEWPVEQDKCRNERERNAENRHQDVTGRHIDNKKVGHLFFWIWKKKNVNFLLQMNCSNHFLPSICERLRKQLRPQPNCRWAPERISPSKVCKWWLGKMLKGWTNSSCR